MPVASHELSADEIRERFGPLLRVGVQAFRDDVLYLVDVAEDWARVHRAPRPLTEEERDRRNMEMHMKRQLTIEVKARQDEILRQRFEENRSSAEVAAELQMHAPDVLHRWRAMGLHAATRPRADVRKAKRAGQAAREEAIRLHASQGMTQQQSADLLGISQVAVSYARKRLGIT